MRPNWELRHCCNHEQVVFLVTVSVCAVVILALWRTVLLRPFKLVTVFLHEASHAIACKLTCGHVEEFRFMQMKVEPLKHVVAYTDLGSSFWGMVLILASTNLLTARIAAGCFIASLLVMLLVAQNICIIILFFFNHLNSGLFEDFALLHVELPGFVLFLGVVWVLQETTKIHILRYIILFIGVMNSLFSVYDIYDDLISRRVHSSDAEKFAEACPCPCNGAGWGFIWGVISFLFLCGAMYLGLVILS
ncbi:hypothetical protein NC651_033564 [Populus alba x Populus x berolinensis]|nr:hypothetical protein NC651_033564 [Populus alba x Populus x berolinensis]